MKTLCHFRQQFIVSSKYDTFKFSLMVRTEFKNFYSDFKCQILLLYLSNCYIYLYSRHSIVNVLLEIECDAVTFPEGSALCFNRSVHGNGAI
jgi:hypothetical protein